MNFMVWEMADSVFTRGNLHLDASARRLGQNLHRFLREGWSSDPEVSLVDTLTRRSTESLASCAFVRVFEAFCGIFGFRPTLSPMLWRGRRESDSEVFCHRC